MAHRQKVGDFYYKALRALLTLGRVSNKSFSQEGLNMFGIFINKVRKDGLKAIISLLEKVRD